jgi:hypothetical protein
MTENVGRLAGLCQTLVDETVQGRSALGEFAEKLRQLGISPEEGKDYVEQLEQRIKQQGKAREKRAERDTPKDSRTTTITQPTQESCEIPQVSTPEGLTPIQADEFRERRSQALELHEQRNEQEQPNLSEEIGWGILRAKLGSLRSSNSNNSISFEDISKLLGVDSSSPSGIPSSVLSAAPHLVSITNDLVKDQHLQETWNLRRAYASEKAIEPIINLMQSRHFTDPIPHSIWRTIIQDMYVNFEKLHASMD